MGGCSNAAEKLLLWLWVVIPVYHVCQNVLSKTYLPNYNATEKFNLLLRSSYNIFKVPFLDTMYF